MGTPRLRSLSGRLAQVVLAGALAAGAAACGGPSDPPPRPLSKHFDDVFLAQVPLEQREAELQAKQAYDRAVLEKAKAEADLKEARVQLDVARNERDAARLDVKSAESRAAAAKQSADMTRVNEADKEVKTAKLAADAADKRYTYLQAYEQWLKKLIRYTEHHAYWREAQYELAQARIAQQNNIQPQGFKPDDYVKQEAERAKKVSQAKDQAEREKATAMGRRKEWLALQGEADKMLGKQSQFPDPLAPEQVKGTDPNMGAGGYTLGADGTGSDQEVQPVQDPTMNSGGGDDEGDLE